MTSTQDRPAKKPPRYPWPIRIAPGGKAAAEEYAREKCGYQYPSEWVRDLIAAEVQNPKHNLRPKPKGKR